MNTNRLLLGWVCALLGAAPLTGCGSSSSDADESNLDAAPNTDVQVISASSKRQLTPEFGGGLDFKRCIFTNRKPFEHTGFTASAKADCTDEVAQAIKAPLLNKYIEPLAFIGEESPGGAVINVSMRHWCQEIEVIVAVKAAAWDSASFEGIGFYGFDQVLNSASSSQRTFYERNDPRLVRIGEGRLKKENGEKVYLYRFGGAGPCGVNGDGDEPVGQSIEFKPHVSYDGDIERWEAVEPNHRLEFEKSWSRKADLLE